MKFLVLGSVNIDTVFSVDHIVRPGETISSSLRIEKAGGKGANQAAALAKAGARVSFAGKIGHDGLWIMEKLNGFNVSTSLVSVCSGVNTGQAVIQVDGNGQNSIILNPGGNVLLEKGEIDGMLSPFGAGDVIVLQNEINGVGYAIEKAKEKGMVVCLNPSPFESGIFSLPLGLVDYFFINEIEAVQLAQTQSAAACKKDFETVLEKLLGTYPDASFILTAGDAGAYYADGNGILFSPIVEHPVVDTTGAGDTFCGFFLASLFSGNGVQTALDVASAASGITVSRSGAMESMPTMKEVVQDAIRRGGISGEAGR